MVRAQSIVITETDRNRLQAVIDRMLQGENGFRHDVQNLQQELNRAQIVDSTSIPEGVVVMNSTVSLRDLDLNELETYTLVYPRDADITQNRISILAPVGTAIIGFQVGDIVTWPVPRGEVRLRIEVVTAPPSMQVQGARALVC